MTPATSPSASEGGRILIVDDETTIRAAATSVLQHLGFQVDSAENGKRGLEMIEENQYSAVLLDLAMPVMNGREALKALRASHPQLPVLLMSGYLADRLEEMLALGGPTAVIQKPFSLFDLKDQLMVLLETAASL